MRVLILLLLLVSQVQTPEQTLLSAPAVQATQPASHSHFVLAVVTAYDPGVCCCGPDAVGLTSTGLSCEDHPRGIAVDPKCIPYGTRIAVPGYGVAIADDTGGAMRQDWKQGVVHIDLRMPSHSEAKSFGIKHMYIEIEDQ